MRKVNALHMVSLGLWGIGLAMVLFWTFGEVRTGSLGLLFAGAGGVLNIRAFLAEMEERERRAFEVGQQFGQGSSGVSRLPGR